MPATDLKPYIKLTEFLGTILGPDYEVVLHDVGNPESSVIAIANGHISGRTIGAPLTDLARRIIMEGDYRINDSRINYTGIAQENGKTLRSSTFYIKNPDGELSGFLCVNFDDSRYRDLSQRLLELRHPDEFIAKNFIYDKSIAWSDFDSSAGSENFHESVTSVTEQAIAQVTRESGVPVDRLTKDEKISIIAVLDEKGVFLIKNAVKQVADMLRCSQASVYRYISKHGD